jgi:hypothetical protein
MRAVSSCATAIVVAAAMLAPGSGAYAQAGEPAVPNVGVITPAAPVEPPYMRDPWKSYARNPYFGRYRVEEDKFSQVSCTLTRIAFSPGGKCLQGYRLTVPAFTHWRGSSPCDMALDVVIDTSGKLSIEADILIFDPHKVVASGGSPPRFCYVRSYLGYDQEDFQDMNQVTRRGTNWHNLQINDSQDQWYEGDRLRSIEFSDGPHNCIGLRRRYGTGAGRGRRLCAGLAANAGLRPGRQLEKGRRSNHIRPLPLTRDKPASNTAALVVRPIQMNQSRLDRYARPPAGVGSTGQRPAARPRPVRSRATAHGATSRTQSSNVQPHAFLTSRQGNGERPQAFHDQ